MNEDHQTQPERVDELLTLLADQQRRAVLRYFQNAPEDTVRVQDLADAIGKENHGGNQETVLRLHHSTLPRLAEIGVLDYDTRSQTVQYLGQPGVETLLKHLSECYPLETH